LTAQNGPNGLRDLGEREAGDRNLIEERLKKMVVRAIENRHAHRRVPAKT